MLNNSVAQNKIAYYHLPGLFEFYELYKVFLPIYREHREYFYRWCHIGSINGAPGDCIWGGGRVGYGDNNPKEVLALMNEYKISARLTFSNSLLEEKHLDDRKCNYLCSLFESCNNQDSGNGDANFQGDIECHNVQPNQLGNGIIVHSDLLLNYLKDKYPGFYYVSSTTKVLTEWEQFENEINRNDFKYVVPDFRLNKSYDKLNSLSQSQKDKVEFLCNECCWIGCSDRKKCYENVSRKSLGETCPDHICHAPDAEGGYSFAKAMDNPSFIGLNHILETYMPNGFTNFKIEGRSLGSGLILEFLLYYMVKPEYQIHVREKVYLNNMLDLF